MYTNVKETVEMVLKPLAKKVISYLEGVAERARREQKKLMRPFLFKLFYTCDASNKNANTGKITQDKHRFYLLE